MVLDIPEFLIIGKINTWFLDPFYIETLVLPRQNANKELPKVHEYRLLGTDWTWHLHRAESLLEFGWFLVLVGYCC